MSKKYQMNHRPTPLFKKKQSTPRPSLKLEPVKQLTPAVLEKRANPRPTKSQLLRAALKSVSWKTSRGTSLQVGITGHVDELNETTKWLSETYDLGTHAVDLFRGYEGSFLDGLQVQTKTHYKAPPTVHERVRVHRELPDLYQKVLFLNIATDDLSAFGANINYVAPGTVVFGEVNHVQKLLDEIDSSCDPMYSFGDYIAVRIEHG